MGVLSECNAVTRRRVSLTATASGRHCWRVYTDDPVELAAGKMARRRVGRVLNKTGEYTALFLNAIWWRCTPRTKRPPPRTHASKNKLLPPPLLTIIDTRRRSERCRRHSAHLCLKVVGILVVPVWVEVLKKVYPALARHYNAVVGGSQVFYLTSFLPKGRGFPLGGSSVPSPGLQRPLGRGSWSYLGQHRGSSAPNRWP